MADNEWQETLIRILKSDVSFSSYDSNFISDLFYKYERKGELTDKQQDYLEYFVYRYRNQIKDSIIYSEPPDVVTGVLEDDVRVQFDQILEECEQSYKVINNDED